MALRGRGELKADSVLSLSSARTDSSDKGVPRNQGRLREQDLRQDQARCSGHNSQSDLLGYDSASRLSVIGWKL